MDSVDLLVVVIIGALLAVFAVRHAGGGTPTALPTTNPCAQKRKGISVFPGKAATAKTVDATSEESCCDRCGKTGADGMLWREAPPQCLCQYADQS